VTFHLNASVLRVKDLGSEKEIVVKDGEGNPISLKAEKILVAMGREPNVRALGLEAIGVEFDRKGIKGGRSNADNPKTHLCRRRYHGAYQFTHAAGYEGGIVVSNAIFHLPRRTNYTFLPWCTYTDPELASVGMNEKRAREAGMSISLDRAIQEQ